jgi:hypothetical protein
MLYSSPSSRFELTTSMVIGTDCIGSCKSNYHTTKTTMAPITLWCSKVVWCCKVSSVLWFRNRWYDFIRSSKINVISIVWRNWIRLKLISSSYLPIDRCVFLRRPYKYHSARQGGLDWTCFTSFVNTMDIDTPPIE